MAKGTKRTLAALALVASLGVAAMAAPAPARAQDLELEEAGGAILYVRGADEDWVGCPNDLHEDPVACMAAAHRAFDTLFSTRLHGGS